MNATKGASHPEGHPTMKSLRSNNILPGIIHIDVIVTSIIWEQRISFFFFFKLALRSDP